MDIVESFSDKFEKKNITLEWIRLNSHSHQ